MNYDQLSILEAATAEIHSRKLAKAVMLAETLQEIAPVGRGASFVAGNDVGLDILRNAIRDAETALPFLRSGGVPIGS